MRDNPIAIIEFVAFIGLVVWLFLWQRGSSRGKSPDAQETREDESSEREH